MSELMPPLAKALNDLQTRWRIRWDATAVLYWLRAAEELEQILRDYGIGRDQISRELGDLDDGIFGERRIHGDTHQPF